MSRAQTIGPKTGGTYRARAAERWHGDAPDWVMVLAQAADAYAARGEGHNALGERLGMSGSAVSSIIGHTYPGSLRVVEAKVRGLLMGATLDCPVQGTIARNVCAENQRMKFSTAHPERARLHRACKTCPNNFSTAKELNHAE